MNGRGSNAGAHRRELRLNASGFFRNLISSEARPQHPFRRASRHLGDGRRLRGTIGDIGPTRKRIRRTAIANSKNMNKDTEHLVHARALKSDILAAPGVWLPRREILLEWLEKFLQRIAGPNYDLGESEAADLVALDKFLRKTMVPVA